MLAVTTGNIKDFSRKLQDAIYEMASYHDANKTTGEIFYHGLMLGLLSGLKDDYEIRSNRESGLGRYDLLIIPKDSNKLGIVMEFKAVESTDKLEQEAQLALDEIKTLKYITELTSRGITRICQIGIAFCGKAIKVVAE